MGISNTATTGKTISATKDTTEKKVVVAKVERYGTNLVIPAGMTLADAEQVIKRAREADEMVVRLNDDIEGFIFDGAHALKLALEELYGWVDVQPTPSFFGKNPPTMLGIEVDESGKTVQVPWGRFLCPAIPAADGYLQSGFNENNKGQFIFSLTAELKQKWAPEFHKLAACVRRHLKEHSIYKGKAISIRFKDDNGKYYPLPKPSFIRLDHVSEAGLVFPDDVGAAIRTNLFTPVDQTEAVRAAGIPLKRGILLAGDYGVGKTLVAYVTAKKAVDNGHTFIYCESIDEFSDVMKAAVLYASSNKIAVVFCEDIDKCLKGERSVNMDHVLNVMDGVDSKRHEILTIFTTNDVAKIHQAAIRPGRLDAVIHVERPDALAAERLVRLYAGARLPASEDLSAVGVLLSGKIPAVIRECVERSKLYAISLGVTNGELTSQAILDASRTMEMQLELLEEKRDVPLSDMAVFGNYMGHQIREAILEGFNDMERNPMTAAIREGLNHHPRTLTEAKRSK